MPGLRLTTSAGYLLDTETDGGYGAEPFLLVGGYGADPFRLGGYGADPFRLSGGYGADPFRLNGGYGADPFRLNGGYGAEPLAIMTAPSLCAITTVFRPIAPTNTNRARSTAVSVRDMECLRGVVKPRLHSISNYTCVKAPTVRACSKRYTATPLILSMSFRPRRMLRIPLTLLTISSSTFPVNGTVVL